MQRSQNSGDSNGRVSLSRAEAEKQIVRTIRRSRSGTAIAITTKAIPAKKPKEVVVKTF